MRRRGRAVRTAGHAQWLRERAVGWIARVAPDVLGRLGPEPTPLGEALTALAAAAVVPRARLLPRVPPWSVIGLITHGRLVAPTARLRL